MILCIGATPAAQRVMVFPSVKTGAVNRATTTLEGIAGKAINVAKVLKALGEEPHVIGFLGGRRGEEIRQALQKRGIDHQFIFVTAGTRQCVTVIDEVAATQTELVEESQPIPELFYEELMETARQRIHKCRAVVISGTLTPGAPCDFYRKCVEIANQASALAILDAKGRPMIEALVAKPGLIKPNHEELVATEGRPLNDERSVVAAMRSLCERGAQRVVITSGVKPTLAFDGSELWRIHPPSVKALNPIGSGDAFTAALTWRVLRGDDLGEACRWGAAAGAANAITLMAAELERNQVERFAHVVDVEKLP